jgi:hypothetical protein
MGVKREEGNVGRNRQSICKILVFDNSFADRFAFQLFMYVQRYVINRIIYV